MEGIVDQAMRAIRMQDDKTGTKMEGGKETIDI